MAPFAFSTRWIPSDYRSIILSTKVFCSDSTCSSYSSCRVVTTEQSLTDKVGLPFITKQMSLTCNSLVLGKISDTSDGELCLYWGGAASSTEKPFFIDFNSNTFKRRASSVSNELVVKAMGKKANSGEVVVWDLTAGLGRDAFLLASAGTCDPV